MDIPDLVGALTELKEKKIKRYPCTVNRASAIGKAVPMLDGCLRRGVYERTHWEEKELHDVRAQFIFDEGSEQEEIVVRQLSQAGVKIINRGQAFTIIDTRPGKTGKILLSGETDGEVVITEEAGHAKDTITCEIKSMNPNIFSQMHEFEDFKKKPWTLGYMAQIMGYMLGHNKDQGLFLLKDKSNGLVRQIHVPMDYEIGEAVLKTAEEINDHVDAGTLPERRSEIDKCEYCEFRKICIPDVNFETGVTVAQDPEFEKHLNEYWELNEASKRCQELYKKIIAPKMKATAAQTDGVLNMEIGEYLLTGKTDSRGTFRPKIRLKAEVEDE